MIAVYLSPCQSGVPVWLCRPIGAEEGLRVDSWVTYPPHMRPKDFVVSYAHANPPHPIVFQGSIASLERYRGMAHYIKKLASPPDFFSNKTGIAIIPSASGSSAATSSLSPRSIPSAAGPSRRSGTATLAQSQRPCQCIHLSRRIISHPSTTDPLPPRPTTNNPRPKGPPRVERDKFADVNSPLMPPSLESWTKALTRVKAEVAKAPKILPAPGINTGYALPDPNVIAGVDTDHTRGYMFTAYVRLRHVLHYRLQSSAFEPLKANAWRRILGIELHPIDGDGHSKAQHQETKKDLCACIEKGGLQVRNVLTTNSLINGSILPGYRRHLTSQGVPRRLARHRTGAISDPTASHCQRDPMGTLRGQLPLRTPRARSPVLSTQAGRIRRCCHGRRRGA